MTALLAVRNALAGYGPGEVLHGVDIEVGANEVVCLLGPNGAGKTTLLRMVAGLVPLRSGQVSLRDRAIHDLPAHRRTKLRMAFVPEGQCAFDSLTVLENLRLGAVAAGKGSDRAWLAGHAEQVFETFPRLRDRQAQASGTLSGGEQKMLAIGRAMMSDPELLLLDEPSLGLAPMLVGQIFEALRELQQRRTIAVLVAEQNADRALSWAGRAYVMSDGRIQYEGTPERLTADQSLMTKLYLGEAMDDA
jgi:branched-chain amino acid transport system ATP-binding protein